MDIVPRGLTKSMVRLGQAAQNALEVARFGGLETDEEPTPFEVVRSHRVYKLRRYGSEAPAATAAEGARRPPVLLVPPMMLSAEGSRGHRPQPAPVRPAAPRPRCAAPAGGATTLP